MTRILLPILLLPGAASAHVGHLGDVAGHDHWLAGAALGAAALGALWAAWKGQGASEGEDAPTEAQPEESEGDSQGAEAEA